MKTPILRGVAIAILSLMFTKSQAQVEVTYGPEIGGSFVSLVEDDDVISYVGFDGQIGGTAHVQFGRFFALRPSVFFRSASLVSDYDSEDKISLLRTGVNMPVLFSYDFGEYGKLYAGAGPSIMFNIGGKHTEYGEETKLKFGSTAEDDLRPIDFGVQTRVGYQFGSGLSLNLFVTTGISNLRPASDAYYGKSRSMDILGFSIGWMFGGSKDDY